MKTEVYSWRVSPERKAELETEARREGTSLSTLLEQITQDWLLARRGARNGDEDEQADLRRRVIATAGKVHGGTAGQASRAREIVRERIVGQHIKESDAARRAH
jgi:hypothetical protein